jgi:hypothetical protein
MPTADKESLLVAFVEAGAARYADRLREGGDAVSRCGATWDPLPLAPTPATEPRRQRLISARARRGTDDSHRENRSRQRCDITVGGVL